MWGRSASPLVVEDLLIVPFGGPAGGPYASLAAYDKKTGELRWKGGEWQVSYASPTLVNLCGTPQVVIVNEDDRERPPTRRWLRAVVLSVAGRQHVQRQRVAGGGRIRESRAVVQGLWHRFRLDRVDRCAGWSLADTRGLGRNPAS